jgi:hypothetical protein
MATVLKLKKGASKEEIQAIHKRLQTEIKTGTDAKKFCGVIKLTEDPLAFQKRIRDEW